MPKHFFTSLALLLSVTVLGCYLKSDGGGTSTGDEVSFETDITALLTAQCGTSGCHAGSTPQGGLNLNLDDTDIETLYTDVSAQIDLDAPEESPLLAKATNTTPHTGGEIFTTSSEEYQTILTWITDGAFNDNCDNVTHGFAADVTPIFSQCNTAGCHDTIAPILTADEFANITAADAIDTENPSASSLLRKPLGLDNHTGGAVFPTKNDDYKTIFCWIKVDDAVEN